MKKRLLLLSMISALALVGCDVTQLKDDQGNQIIVKLGDGTAYTANDLFENYTNTSAGASEYYSAVYDVLIRAVQPKTSAIEDAVAVELDNFIDTCKQNASTNGTTYKTELSKALENKGVESLDELQELYYLEQQKIVYEDAFYDDNLSESLLEEYINYYAPYHVRHILVKNSADSSLYNGTISKDDAINLADTVTRLASGRESFGVIAQSTASNGDSSSAEIYGDVGIMDTSTGFVSEFKYSIYQYDAFYNAAAQESVQKFDARQATRTIGSSEVPGSSLIPVSDDDVQYLKDSINRIPFSVFGKLKDVAGIETGLDGLQVYDGKEEYYPRNYLYNTYLNNHALGVIVKGSTVSSSDRWQTIDGLSASQADADKVLCDEEGRPILVSKAGTGTSDSGYQGIHFIIIQKSAFTSTLEELKAYYDTTVYSSSADVSDKNTYVTYISSDRTTYSTRAETIKTNVKGFDTYMSYRIYEQALAQATSRGASISEDIASIIDRYIAANRETSAYETVETYEDSWKSYLDLLNVQDMVSSLKVQKEAVATAFGVDLDIA